MQYAYDTAAAAQTATSLVAADAKSAVWVYQVMISTDTQMRFDLNGGAASAELDRWFLPANGGVVAISDAEDKPLYKCAKNVALTYDSSAAGNTKVRIGYKIKGD